MAVAVRGRMPDVAPLAVWRDRLAVVLPQGATVRAADLLVSHTHMTLNRPGAFVHDEYQLAETAVRLWTSATGPQP
ncbi:hypothetical protein [Streptomyces sp. RPT161]|uniref:hypothetical protein n=1 Tax=Streptomyces sp. RPT161 TaxID=3015993 RepID=UPI0022B8EC6D|nr:hypothetical protein [Streptomyces sp. RPT161]